MRLSPWLVVSMKGKVEGNFCSWSLVLIVEACKPLSLLEDQSGIDSRCWSTNDEDGSAATPCTSISRADHDALTPCSSLAVDDYDAQAAAEKKRARSFRKFSYRGVELDNLLDMSNEDFMKIVHARVRRRFQRGLKRKPMGLIKKLRKAKAEAPPNEKPAPVKTHLRGELIRRYYTVAICALLLTVMPLYLCPFPDMVVVPEMIGSVISIYNGKVFNTVEIRPEMTGHYLAEFSMSYIPTRHGKPGLGATNARFIPLK